MGKRRGKVYAQRFDLALSMECGQVFGWEVSEGWYYGFIDSVAVALSQRGEEVLFEAEKPLDASRVARYLGLNQDFETILREIIVDEFMSKAVDAVGDLRLFEQDPWTCLCSFILSTNNRVERIDQIFKTIAHRFGVRRKIKGRLLYRWPEPARLALIGESDLYKCGTGFRAKYLSEAAKAVLDGRLDLAGLRSLPYEEARARLMEIKGVGEKIADCVLLFAYARYESFPVDVWIKRVIEKIYFKGRKVSRTRVGEFGRSYFGRFAGYAQEYIYHYARRFMIDL